MNIFEDLFDVDEPEHFSVLSCYGPLKEDYKDKLKEHRGHLLNGVRERNEERLQKVKVLNH